MNLEWVAQSLINTDKGPSEEALRLIVFSSVDEVTQAADTVGESADYVLESALEKLADRQLDTDDIIERVRSYWLRIEHVPGGTIYEIAVRSAEFLAAVHRRQGMSERVLENWSTSPDWRERLVCAWSVRDATDPVSQSIRIQLAGDPFQDDDGIYLIREGAGHYDD